jgi:hypothetical protein
LLGKSCGGGYRWHLSALDGDEKAESPRGEECPGLKPFVWAADYRGLKRLLKKSEPRKKTDLSGLSRDDFAVYGTDKSVPLSKTGFFSTL